MTGSMIAFSANGHKTPGFLSLPPGGRGPAVIVVQEWWGLVGHITAVADRFAAAGFVALAPDFYHGTQATSPDEAGKLMMALDIARVAADLRGAADFLLAHPAVTSTKVGTVGFCMGGQLAVYAAIEYPERIGAAVDFYGIHPNVPLDASRLRVPVLAHFGKTDRSIPEAAARGLADQCTAAGARFDAHFYDAGHAFFNDARPQVYDATSATLAWERTLAFLREHVR